MTIYLTKRHSIEVLKKTSFILLIAAACSVLGFFLHFGDIRYAIAGGEFGLLVGLIIVCDDVSKKSFWTSVLLRIIGGVVIGVSSSIYFDFTFEGCILLTIIVVSISLIGGRLVRYFPLP